jgi:mRNA interferase HigB
MRVISRKKLRQFWENHPEARQSLQAWYADIKHANWKKPSDIKSVYQTASFISNNRVVFNIKGNKYRIVVVIEYLFGIVFIRYIGTHQEYNHINVEAV